MQDADRSPSPTRVVALPTSDPEFTGYVRGCLTSGLDAEALEARVRREYPRARVVASELEGRDAVWYAYRDGRWMPAGGPSTL